MSETRAAWGYGLATVTEAGQVLDTWFPSPTVGTPPRDAGAYGLPSELTRLEATDPRREVRTQVMRVEADLDAAPQSPPDAYLRLHLLSHRLVRPHEVNLTGIFGVLVNVVEPGWVRTPLTDAVPQEVRDAAVKESLLGVLLDPADIANAVLYLCGEGGRRITGQILRVDGGQQIG